MFELDTLIPHQGTMRLLDSVSDITEEGACAEVHVTEDSTFYEETLGGIAAWVGIEWMAQCVAAFAGARDITDASPSVGLLLSVRKFTCTLPCYPLGAQFSIHATKEYLEDQVGVFNCEIHQDNQVIASAKLNTIKPAPEQLKSLLTKDADE